eukprot:scaffold2807_cov60-Phaeocystis_antarctica.AAC.8
MASSLSSSAASTSSRRCASCHSEWRHGEKSHSKYNAHGGDRPHVEQAAGACAHGHCGAGQHEEDKLWPPADIGRWVGKK